MNELFSIPQNKAPKAMKEIAYNPQQEEDRLLQESKRFSSEDPYVILGVSQDASKEDIKKAWAKAQKEFHPDLPKNKDNPRVLEICKKINSAYEVLTKECENREGKKMTKEKAERIFWGSLTLRASSFAKWVSTAEKVGISTERIQELIQSDRAQKIIKDKFVKEAGSWGKDDPDFYLEYMENWKAAGVELKHHLDSPEIRAILVEQANVIAKLSVDDPDEFLEFAESWKKAGIDLGKIVTKSPEAIKYLTNEAIDTIKLNANDPAEFLKFAEPWKKAGIDLGKIVTESPEAAKYFANKAFMAAKTYGYDSDKFLKFAELWRKAGIDLGKIVAESPEAVEYFAGKAVNTIKRYNVKGFLPIAKSWKEAGIDLGKIVANSPEGMRYITSKAFNAFKLLDNTPAKFLELVESYKQVGINLDENFVNSPEATEYLEKRAKTLSTTNNKEEFTSFVQSWIDAGWKPSAEIMDALEED